MVVALSRTPNSIRNGILGAPVVVFYNLLLSGMGCVATAVIVVAQQWAVYLNPCFEDLAVA